MANFTGGEASELADEFIGHVETNGSKVPTTSKSLEAFSTVPTAFMHNPDEIREASWESREAMRIASHRENVREGHSSLPYIEQQLRERRCQ